HFHAELDRTLSTIAELTEQLLSASAVNTALTEHAGIDAIALGSALETAKQALGELRAQAATRADTLAEKKRELVELEAAAELTKSWTLIEAHVRNAKQALGELRAQAATRADTLAEKKRELVELEAAAELTKSWTLIESHVRDAKQADRLTLLAKPMPGLLRAVTGLAKTASDQMINES